MAGGKIPVLEDGVGVQEQNADHPHAPVVHVVPRSNLRNIVYIFAIGVGMIAGGAINAMIATTLAQPSFIIYFNLTAGNSTTLIGATNGTFYAGGFFGVFFGAWAADRFGRRKAIAVNCIMATIWMALLAGSVHIAMFITIRYVDRLSLHPSYTTLCFFPHC